MLKQFVKKLFVRLAQSSSGPVLLRMLNGIYEIVNSHAGRKYRDEMTERLAVSDLVCNNIPSDVLKMNTISYNTKKIKVRFFHYHPTTFNVIETVCEAFRNDNRYDVLIVLFDRDFVANVKQMEEKGYNYIEEFNYNLEKDHPDISVIYHLEIMYPPQLTKIRDHSSYVALVPLGLGSMWYGNRETTLNRMNLDRYKADICFVSKICYDGLEDAIGKEIIAKCTPAQFDMSYRKFQKKKTYPPTWEKLRGKKVVMLMTDHGIRTNRVSDEVSFDIYFRTLIVYMNEHKDMGLVLRLHPALITELLSSFWSIGDYNSFVNFCAQSDNIIWDTTDDYLNGLSIADACLVDVNCSLVYFVLAANIPTAVLLRDDMPVAISNPELIKYYYNIKSIDDLVHYLENVEHDQDPMKEHREYAFREYIERFDGQNGLRIKKKIEDSYFEKYPAYYPERK